MMVTAPAIVQDPVTVTAFVTPVSWKPSNVATSGMTNVLAVAKAVAASSIPAVATTPIAIPREHAMRKRRPAVSLEDPALPVLEARCRFIAGT